MAAVRAPVADGAKRRVIVVLLPGVTGAIGLFVTANIAASVPSIVTPRPVRLAAPVFFSRNVSVVVEPTVTVPKFRLSPDDSPVPAGCSTTKFGTAPLPVRLRSNDGVDGSLLATWSAAVFAPAVAGANCRTNVVLLAGASVAGGGGVTEKLDASVPVIVTAMPVRVCPPVFRIAKVFERLLPSATVP